MHSKRKGRGTTRYGIWDCDDDDSDKINKEEKDKDISP